MSEITTNELKQELMDTIKKIDKDKITITDMKIIAETISVLSTIKETQTDYMDILLKMSSNGFGYKPITVSDLRGDE